MRIIKNYTDFVNENLLPKYRLFENVALTILPVTGIDEEAVAAFTASNKTFQTLKEKAQGSKLVSLTDDKAQMRILMSLLLHGQKQKKGWWFIKKEIFSIDPAGLAKKAIEEFKKGTLALELQESRFKAAIRYSSGSSTVIVSTKGKMADYSFDQNQPHTTYIDTEVIKPKTTSRAENLCEFVNEWNKNAFAKGTAQYKLSDLILPAGDMHEGAIDLVSAPAAVDLTTLYQYSWLLTNAAQVAVNVETTVTKTGGATAVNGKFAAGFAAGKSDITPAVQAEVDEAVALILTQFPAGKVPAKFSIESGASSEMDGKDFPTSTGVGPVSGTGSEQKNQALAYQRGKNFMDAVNTKLAQQGHPGLPQVEITWTIAKSGKPKNPADRFLDMNIQKNAAAPVTKVTNTATTVKTGGGVTNLQKTGEMFELRLVLVNKGTAPAAAPAAPAEPAN